VDIEEALLLFLFNKEVFSLTVLLFCGLVFASVSGFSVIGDLRNEFVEPLLLKSATLQSGAWDTQPAQSFAASTEYSVAWKASGTDGVVGTVNYGIASDARIVVSFYFENIDGNQTFTAKVTPPPWIGGTGTPAGTTSDAVFYFWTHEMCMPLGRKDCITVS